MSVKRNRLSIAIALIVGLATGLLPLSPGLAQQPRTIPLNFKRIEIQELLARVAEANQRTILFDEQVRGNVSIVAKRPVTLEESWAILEASLSMLGFSLLPSTAGNYRISKIAQAVGEAPFALRPRPEGESFVTTLIPIDVAELAPILKVLEPLSGSRVTLVPFAPTNSIIASGPERAIARLTRIADELDVIAENPLRLRVLRYRDVAEAEPLIEAHLDSIGAEARTFQVWTDARTNSVLFRGTADQRARFARLLDGYDVPVRGEGQIRILRVRNRDPEEVAELIRGRAGRESGDRPVDENGAGDTSGRDEDSGADAGAPDLSSPRPSASVATSSGPEDEYSIVVDSPTRSLIVRGSEEAQREVQELLEQLDRQPQLIAVDVTVTELRTPSQWALDFSFLVPLAAGNDAGDLIATLVSSSGTGALLGKPTEGSTVFGRVTRSSEVPFLVDDGTGTRVPVDYNAAFEGVDRQARTEVLIQPSLVVTSGEDQEIFVGNNYPVPVTEPDAEGISELGALVSRTTTFERRDVGIRMGIQATSGVEGKIRLDLDLEISALVPSLAGPIEEVGPSFLNERLTVTAHLEDGETALLAMDRERQDVDVIRGTPFLSSIPFIGFLFTGKAKTSEDTRLIIAARTRRMSSPSELVADTIRRRLAFERANDRDVTMPSNRTDPYAVRVTTRSRLDDAEAIGEGLALAGHETEIHRWTDLRGDALYDVYVVSLESMADAAEIARDLADDGWETDVVVLPTRS